MCLLLRFFARYKHRSSEVNAVCYFLLSYDSSISYLGISFSEYKICFQKIVGTTIIGIPNQIASLIHFKLKKTEIRDIITAITACRSQRQGGRVDRYCGVGEEWRHTGVPCAANRVPFYNSYEFFFCNSYISQLRKWWFQLDVRDKKISVKNILADKIYATIHR